MHAFLLINSDPVEFAKKESAKVIPFILQKIEDSKELKKITKFKFNEKTAIVIENIDSATTEAANAFLKNLEEPNQNLIYILTAKIQENVLPTIISRCEIVRSSFAIKSQINNKQSSITAINYKEALNIKERDEAIGFVENLIYFDKQKNNFKNMENYLNTIKNLKLNGNVSLQLLNLVARMESHG